MKPTLAAAAALLAFLALVAACRDAPTPNTTPPFPAELAQHLLDQPLPDAIARLKDAWPQATTDTSPFVRTTLPDHPWLEEIVLFQDLRAARVNTVILKYRAELNPAELKQALTAAGGPALSNLMESPDTTRELNYRPGVVLRARKRDKQGRLTLTLDAARPTSPPTQP